MVLPVEIVNGTIRFVQQSDPSTSNLVYATWALAGATIVIGYFTIRYSQKQNQRNALMEIFKMLNDKEHKYSESLIIDRFRQKDLYNMGTIPQAFEASAYAVLRNYDQLGLLTSRRGLIPKKDDILYMFGTLVVVSHLVLFEEINNRRLTQEKYFMTNFTELAIDCYDYWKRKNHIPRHPLTNEPITQNEVDRWKESLPKK